MCTNSSARDHFEWRPWGQDAYAALGRNGGVGARGVRGLSLEQSRALHELIDDLLTYQCLIRKVAQIPDGHRLVESQAADITADLAALAALEVEIHWRSGADGNAIELRCRH